MINTIRKNKQCKGIKSDGRCDFRRDSQLVICGVYRTGTSGLPGSREMCFVV